MDARGTYPLHVAAEFGQPGAARALLKYGADVSLLDLENEAVALGWAAFFGRPEVAAVLLEAGSEPTQQARPYTTRLHRGRNAGQMEAVFQRDGRRVAARGRDHPFVWRVE
jgi:ankyrin repeat protein